MRFITHLEIVPIFGAGSAGEPLLAIVEDGSFSPEMALDADLAGPALYRRMPTARHETKLKGLHTMQHKNDPMLIDLTGAEPFAFASSAEDMRDRWTELAVYQVGERFVAVTRGLSDVAGERTKERRLASPRLERALTLFDDSPLARSVKMQAEEWLESQVDAPAPSAAPASDRPWLAKGDSFTDQDALVLLYGEAPTGRKGYSGLLASDFGVSESTARAAIAKGTAIKVPLARILPFLDLEALAAARAADNA